MQCPKCDVDISDSYQPAEPDVGIMSSGYYCDACDLVVVGTGHQIAPSNNGCCSHCNTPLESGYGFAGGGGIGPYMFCPAENCGKTFIKSKDHQ